MAQRTDIIVKRNFADGDTPYNGCSDITIYHLSCGNGDIMPHMLLHQILEAKLPLNNETDLTMSLSRGMKECGHYCFADCGGELIPCRAHDKDGNVISKAAREFDVFRRNNIKMLIDPENNDNGAMVVEVWEKGLSFFRDKIQVAFLPGREDVGEKNALGSCVSLVDFLCTQHEVYNDVGLLEMYKSAKYGVTIFGGNDYENRFFTAPAQENLVLSFYRDYQIPNIPLLSSGCEERVFRKIEHAYQVDDIQAELEKQLENEFDSNGLSTFDTSLVIGKSEFITLFDVDEAARDYDHTYNWTLDGSLCVETVVSDRIDEVIDMVAKDREKYSSDYFESAKLAYGIILDTAIKKGIYVTENDASGLLFTFDGYEPKSSLADILKPDNVMRQLVFEVLTKNSPFTKEYDNFSKHCEIALSSGFLERTPEVNYNPAQSFNIDLSKYQQIKKKSEDMER